MMEILSDVPTNELITELERREGVSRIIAEPYREVSVSVNGPAIILQVID